MIKRVIFSCLLLLAGKLAVCQESIHEAAKAGDLKKVMALIKSNKSLVNLKDQSGLTPLHFATTSNLELVKYLLSKGANINERSNNGSTPLYTAARFGQTEIARYLLENKADYNARSDGGSPLHQAVYRGGQDMVELLLSYKPDLTFTDKQGQTVVFGVATWNAYKVLPLLIEAGSDINATDNLGDTPLHACLYFADANSPGSLQTAAILIQNNASLNVKNNKGETPLALAKIKGATEMARLLEEAGAEE